MAEFHDKVVNLAWHDVQPGMRMRFVTPSFVKRGELLAKKRASCKIHFDGDARPTVLPDGRHYYAMAKGGHENEDWTLVVIEDDGLRELPTERAQSETEEWITPATAAQLHGIAPKRLRTLLRQGKILGKRDGYAWLVESTSVERWMSGER